VTQSDHNHSRAHDHHHGPGHTHGASNERALSWGFLLTFGFMLAEVGGGFMSGSLALLADAGHMLTDAAALGLAWLGFRIARRAPDERRSFGYARFEVLAGLANAVTLLIVVAWIAVEAVGRLQEPQPVLAGPMAAVALLGLVVNIGVFMMLSRADREHVNVRGAIIHVAGDLLGSVAALVAAGVIHATGWTPIDPLLSLLVGLLILKSAWSLLRHSLHILLEGAPEQVDVGELRRDLVSRANGIVDVHHVHVWSLTSGKNLATLHVGLSPGADQAVALESTIARLAERFGIVHATIQVDVAGVCPDALGNRHHGSGCAT
jgi:cobalt-zinc-cadmium efflux system protein